MIQRLLIIAAGIIRKLQLNRQIAVIADILQCLDYRGIIADAASVSYTHLIHEMDYILKVLNGEMTIEEYPIRKDEVMNVVSMICLLYTSRCV